MISKNIAIVSSCVVAIALAVSACSDEAVTTTTKTEEAVPCPAVEVPMTEPAPLTDVPAVETAPAVAATPQETVTEKSE